MAEKKTLRIALAGNPNSGKTSVFNCLTGARQHVGNWPGVTVERKTGRFSHRGYDIEVVDLPGTYSLTAYSVEERIARDFIVEERPDVVIDVVDSANLARHLYLTVQLLEIGVDVVVALNMWDEFEASGATLDRASSRCCSARRSCRRSRSAARGSTTCSTRSSAWPRTATRATATCPSSYGAHVDDVVTELTAASSRPAPTSGLPSRWVAMKLLEGDAAVAELVPPDGPQLTRIREIARRGVLHIAAPPARTRSGSCAEGRHGFIAGALREVLTETQVDRMELSRRIDRVFTHRLLGCRSSSLHVAALQAHLHARRLPHALAPSLVDWVCGPVSAGLPKSLVTDLFVDGIVGGRRRGHRLPPEHPAPLPRHRGARGLRLHGARGVPHGPPHARARAPREVVHPDADGVRVQRARDHGDAHARVAARPDPHDAARPAHVVQRAAAGLPPHRPARSSARRRARLSSSCTCSGIVAAIALGRLLSSTMFRSSPEPFVMELPPYRRPTPRGLSIHMWERAKLYLRKMGGRDPRRVRRALVPRGLPEGRGAARALRGRRRVAASGGDPGGRRPGRPPRGGAGARRRSRTRSSAA